MSLQQNSFIDASTRAVVVEFNLLHAPTSLLTSVAILFEFPPIGGVRSQVRVATAAVYRYVTAFDNFVLACEVIPSYKRLFVAAEQYNFDVLLFQDFILSFNIYCFFSVVVYRDDSPQAL